MSVSLPTYPPSENFPSLVPSRAGASFLSRALSSGGNYKSRGIIFLQSAALSRERISHVLKKGAPVRPENVLSSTLTLVVFWIFFFSFWRGGVEGVGVGGGTARKPKTQQEVTSQQGATETPLTQTSGGCFPFFFSFFSKLHDRTHQPCFCRQAAETEARARPCGYDTRPAHLM